MKTSKSKFNFIASVVGLMLTASVALISASSQPTIADATAATQVVAQASETASAPAVTAASAAAAVTQPSAQTPAPTASTASQPPTQTVATTNSSGYANGTYEATGTYRTPGSEESIDVSLTVNNGIITAASISQSGNDPESARYQSRFASAYKSYVVGKSLSSLNLSRVSGSSLTTDGFNSAVAQIQSQAKA